MTEKSAKTSFEQLLLRISGVMKTYKEFNDYYKDGKGNVRSTIPDFHIFRFNQLGDKVLEKFGPFKTEYFQFAIGSSLASNVSVFNKEFIAQDFSIVIFIPGQIIEWERTGNWDGYVINVKSDFIGDSIFEKSINSLNFLNSLKPLIYDINEQQYNLLSNLSEIILAEHEKLQEENIAVIKHLLRVLLIYFGRIIESKNMGSVDFDFVKQTRIAYNFKQAVLQNYLTSKDVAFYANLLGTTTVMLNKYIKQVYNKSPKELISEMLILHAKSRFSKSGTSVKEVAYELNFDDYSHFVKFFKKMEGVSPAEFIKNLF